MRRFFLLLALAGSLACPPLFAQDKPPVPAAAAGKRTAEQIQADLQKASAELREALTSPDVMIDPALRKEAAPKVIPVIKRMSALMDEAAIVEPEAKEEIAAAKLEFLTLLATFGDDASAAALSKIAGAPGGAQALDAQVAVQLVAYLTHSKDEAAQLKAIDELQKLAKANAKSDAIAATLMKMTRMGPASPAVALKAEDVIVADLTGEYARHLAGLIKGQRKLRESVGKPVVLAATKLDGTPFTTKDWKGKVILVDFWATWCPPCLQVLPKVKKAYITHHAKGLEILGVSSDNSDEDLKGFLDKNKDAPWPQLFHPKLPDGELHPLAKEWGVSMLPTMFLIDRKGILRNVDAEKDFEEEIPKLLEEKAE